MRFTVPRNSGAHNVLARQPVWAWHSSLLTCVLWYPYSQIEVEVRLSSQHEAKSHLDSICKASLGSTSGFPSVQLHSVVETSDHPSWTLALNYPPVVLTEVTKTRFTPQMRLGTMIRQWKYPKQINTYSTFYLNQILVWEKTGVEKALNKMRSSKETIKHQSW